MTILSPGASIGMAALGVTDGRGFIAAPGRLKVVGRVSVLARRTSFIEGNHHAER